MTSGLSQPGTQAGALRRLDALRQTGTRRLPDIPVPPPRPPSGLAGQRLTP